MSKSYRVRRLKPGARPDRCSCEIRREWVIGAYRAGLYGRFWHADTLSRVKRVLDTSYQGHELGYCRGLWDNPWL